METCDIRILGYGDNEKGCFDLNDDNVIFKGYKAE